MVADLADEEKTEPEILISEVWEKKLITRERARKIVSRSWYPLYLS